ncbi:hypothetical protein LCGC14_0795620 [marine sediment metagenome]|uniref:Uncharacterized protein n=1 Tax=marine sediment metagenome TaxID=412755 RepID=A0A0F9SYK3_9ZZZZ
MNAAAWEKKVCDCPRKGRLVLTKEILTTGPDTSWREQPIVTGCFRCGRCGQNWLFSRKPTDEERPRCLKALRKRQAQIEAQP